MSGLELLSNRLEQVATLNGEGVDSLSFRTDPLTNAPTWNAATQYFKGDWVRDPVDFQLYCWLGPTVAPPALAPTCVRGGTSPYNAGFGTAGWVKAGPVGVDYYDTVAPTATIAGGAAPGVAWTALANNVATVPADSDWLVTIQGRLAAAAPLVAESISELTLTPAGAAPGTAANATWFMAIGQQSADFSSTLFVRVPAAAAPPAVQTGTITLTGKTTGVALTLSDAVLTWVRLA